MASTPRFAVWSRRFLDGALLALILTCAVAVVLARVLPLTGRATLVVAGGSMAPAIGVGSVVVVDPVDPSSLAVGDIVSLQSGPSKAVFTHRIVRIAERDGAVWIETKGDANATVDPSITPASDVIGRVGLTIPAVGYLIAMLSKPGGILFALSLGLALWLAAAMLESPTFGRRPTAVARDMREDAPAGAIDPA